VLASPLRNMPRNSKLTDFLSKRDRDAWATIRGYVYQVDSTILRWAKLTENQILELERGEDLDTIGPAIWKGREATCRVLEQIKRLDGSISLRSEDALEALANFHEHRQANRRRPLDLFFRFSTTALPAREKPAGPLTFTPGILLWERLRSGDAPSSAEKDTEAVLAFLRKARKPNGFSAETWGAFVAFIRHPGSDFFDFIRRFEWATGAEPSAGLTAQLYEAILANDPGLRQADAALKHDQLFGYVIRLLARSPKHGRRTLTRRDFQREVARSKPDLELTSFLAEFGELRDFLSRQLSTITSDLVEVKVNTREILSRLPAQKDLTPLLERVVDPDAVLECFGSASRSLISWPQETNGRWIERKELQELEKLLQADAPNLAVLLGEAGSGKSALLAKLAVKISDSGAALLALKIDQLPRTVRSLQELDSEWFPACGLVDGVRAIVKQKPIVVLIDQLDALASLIDQQSNRLDVVLQVIRVLRGIPNVRILLSCREFDFKYDSRFNSIQATQVHLTDPPWDRIEPILRDAGINSSQWSTESKEVLRKPQHLSLFVSFLTSDAIVKTFSSYEAMLEAVFTERVIKPFGAPAVRTCEMIAAAMAESGEIWLPTLQFDADHRDNVERLLAAGILRRDARLLGFQHQTMFDYVRVRSFCSGIQDLSSYVLEHQGTLFVRSTLWAAANSMRSLVRGGYHKQVGSLWRNPMLRKHVRFLLLSFIGQVADPDYEETQWLLPALDSPLRDKALLSMVGSSGWFSKLRSRLPTLMGSDDPQLSWELTMIVSFRQACVRPGDLAC
jgi:NACHT domain